MRTLAAYIGPDIGLDQFLLNPPQGLLARALRPAESRAAAFGGYGIGWYAADDAPAVYTSPMPIWTDANLPHLARSLYGDLWLATVRDTAPPFGASASDTQPFCDDQLIFMHDGCLGKLGDMRRIIRDFLEPHIEADIRGNTDSEHLFALLRHLLSDDAEISLEEALVDMCKLLEEWLGDNRGELNIVLTEGECIYALRHAINADCPALYYTVDDEAFPEGQLVASARLTEAEFWQPVPEHHLLTLDPTEPAVLLAL